MNVVAQFPVARNCERDPLFRAMFEGAAIGIAICRLDGWILEANPTLSTMLGYSRQELAGTHTSEFCPELRRGLRAEVGREVGREVHPGNSSPAERRLAELMRGERGSFETEKRCRRKDGAELWGHLTVSLGRDARREPAFLIVMLADATERKRVEEHLREAEKMEVIGRLAGGIAHDFNNLLTGILLYCDLLIAGLENHGSKSGGFENSGLETSEFKNGWERRTSSPACGRSPAGGRAGRGADASAPGNRAQASRGAAPGLDQRNCRFHGKPVAAADRRAD